MIKVVAIKPAPGTLSPEKYKRAIAEGTRKAVYEARDLLVKPTAAWKGENKPAPIVRYGPDGGSVEIRKKVYIYQDFGTKRHVIVPRKKRALRFKTQGKIVFTKRVNHPGTEPKNYSKSTAAVMSLAYQKHLNDAIAKVVP